MTWVRGLARHTSLLNAGTEWHWPIGALALLGILAFNFWMGMALHWDYSYPLHVDEWIHLAHTQEMQHSGSLTYTAPFSQGAVSYHYEFGFHVLLGFVEQLTGLSWKELYRIAPGFQMSLLAFSVYALGARSGFGWAAALLIPLVPTSIRTLGPSFLVPVTTALIFIPVTLMVIFATERRGTRESLLPLLVLVAGTLFIHPTTEGVVMALAGTALAFLVAESLTSGRYREAGKLVVGIGVRIAIPVLFLGIWLPAVVPQVLELSVPVDQFPGGSGSPELEMKWGTMVGLLGFHQGFLNAFGFVGVGLFIVGLIQYMLLGRGFVMFALPGLAIALSVFLLMVFPRYALGHPSSYERGWLHLGVFMVILGGYAVGSAAHQGLRWIRLPRSGASGWPKIFYALGLFGMILVLGAALVTGLTSSARARYEATYRVVNDIQAADFAWIGRHGQGSGVVMEPSLAFAFPALAGPERRAYLALASPFSNATSEKIHIMVRSGVVDTAWLRRRDIRLFYTCLPASNTCTSAEGPGVSEIRRGLYWIPP